MIRDDHRPAPLLTIPFDVGAEKATLGALLLERDAILNVAPWLLPAHFYLEKHAQVYAAILRCYHRREPPDLATVAAELRNQGQLADVGGMTFLAELMQEVPTAVHLDYYARVVEHASVGRRLIEVGGQIAALGFDTSRPISERLEEASQAVFGVSADRQAGQDFVHISTVVSEYFDAVTSAEPGSGDLLGVSTGFPDLDAITRGFKPGELILLAARPGVGKTSLALTIAYLLARQGQRIGIFSLEMDRELLLQRLLALDLGLETTEVPRLIRRGEGAVMRRMGELSELPIYIDHTPSLRILTIRDRARRLQADGPIDLWMVDYLQLAQSSNDRDDDVRRTTAISQGLMHMARELRTPVLALSQLSRAVEGRQDHLPVLSDLRGSGSLEQDASQVWFIYRDELYNRETETPGVAEIHVAKHRNGPTGVAPLRFDRATTRFWPLERFR